MALLDIRNLSIDITTAQGTTRVIDKVSLHIVDGSIHGLFGESGSGKSLIASAILGIHNPNWKVTVDRMFLDSKDLTKLSPSERRKIMGKEIAMIFQHPRSYLDPSKKILPQLNEVLPDISLKNRIFDKIKHARKKTSTQQIKELFHKVGIQNDQAVLQSYPHQLSEGICQKIMIAMAIANNPRLIIADEPTNAMEAVTQAQILRLLYKLNRLHSTTILLLSNNFDSICHLSDFMTLIYCGQAVESGSYKQIIDSPMHPYTEAMIKTTLNFNQDITHKSELYTLTGNIPSSNQLPIGCRLGPRCPRAQKTCVQYPDTLNYKGHMIRCHYPTLDEKTA